MEYNKLIEELLNELSYRVGIVDLKNKTQQSVISEILTEWGEYEAKSIILDFLNEAGKTPEKNKPKSETEGEDANYTHIGKGIYVKKGDEEKDSAQKYKKDDTGSLKPISDDEYNKEKGEQGKEGEQAAQNTPQNKTDNPAGQPGEEAQPETGTSLQDPTYQDVVKKEKETLDKINGKDTTIKSNPQSNDDIRSEISEIQSELQSKRDMGIAGAGGALASQGESRYCNTMNTLDEIDFKNKNKNLINSEIEKLKSRTGRSKFPSASESTTLTALGLDPTSDEAFEYIANREVFAQQELQRIKAIPNSVFFLKGKQGFSGNDEPYLEWMRASYDGTLATRKILDENTNMDMSKPNTTMQSETEIDDNVADKIKSNLEQAKNSNNQDDINYYTNELNSFQKFRKYHDTYTVGQDSNGRMCVVSISNKKGDDLKDPQNNTTPANRFNIIKNQYGNDVAKTVIKSIDEGISTVSDVKQSAVKSTNQVDIDENIIGICNLPEMKKYMDTLNNNATFIKFIANKGKSIELLSTGEKLNLMKEHSQLLIDSGKKPAFEPYGKIMTKIGEFSIVNKFKNSNSNIDFESPSIKRCINIKQTEKDAVTASHDKVVDDIKEADSKLGFPKDGKNGPHIQGYIGTVMDAMHFDSYIDGGDGKMIIQMGIRGAQPQDIRNCLAEQSGFTGDTTTTDGRNSLKKHLRETCNIDSKSGAIIIKGKNKISEICEDTWRTAGTSQKVASGFGSDMRNCISSKVDTRRNSK